MYYSLCSGPCYIILINIKINFVQQYFVSIMSHCIKPNNRITNQFSAHWWIETGCFFTPHQPRDMISLCSYLEDAQNKSYIKPFFYHNGLSLNHIEIQLNRMYSCIINLEVSTFINLEFRKVTGSAWTLMQPSFLNINNMASKGKTQISIWSMSN